MTERPSADKRPRTAELFELGHLTMTSQRRGAEHVVALFGELDLATADAVEEELVRVEATDAATIVLDLAGLTFMDSTGVRLILGADGRSRDDTGRLSLRRGPANVQRVLEIAGIEHMLPFAD